MSSWVGDLELSLPSYGITFSPTLSCLQIVIRLHMETKPEIKMKKPTNLAQLAWQQKASSLKEVFLIVKLFPSVVCCNTFPLSMVDRPPSPSAYTNGHGLLELSEYEDCFWILIEILQVQIGSNETAVSSVYEVK